MPTYVYRREDGTLFEYFQNITDPPLTEDPDTGQPVSRVITGGAGLQFKGSGFYLTDYARKGSTAPSEGGESGSATAKGEGKSGKETKPAPKSED